MREPLQFQRSLGGTRSRSASQAAALHRSLDDRVARLLIHGVLHLIGYDHEVDEEAREMAREERRLWRALPS